MPTGSYTSSQFSMPSLQDILGVLNTSSNESGIFSSNSNLIISDYGFSSNFTSGQTNSLISNNSPSIASYSSQDIYGYSPSTYNYAPINYSFLPNISYISQGLGLSPNLSSQMSPQVLTNLLYQQAQLTISRSNQNTDNLTFSGRNVFPPATGYAQGNSYPTAYPFPLGGSSYNSSPMAGFYGSSNNSRSPFSGFYG
jgi:hypothetical protein